MQTVKTIAIVGATEKIGSAIAESLSKANYRLLLMANEQEKLSSFVAYLMNNGATAEIEASTCAKEASWEADMIIIATPYEDEKKVAEKIKQVAIGKIVISVSNPLSLGNPFLASTESSAAEELQKLLPYSKVVKTFNTAFSTDLVSVKRKKADVFIAGNSGEAVETVSQVIRTAGFNPLIVGDLSLSRTLERMQLDFMHKSLQYHYNWLAGLRILNN